jgi:hypothetical protein
VRGGIGVFQNVPAASFLTTALERTGLPGALQQLRCVGDAVPNPDWSAFLADVESIPRRCADGTIGSGFGSAAPNVSVFDRHFVAPRSVRSNLQWNGPVLWNRLAATVDAIYSLNLNQPNSVDLNFARSVRFVLPGEGGRPVFVDPTSIVPGSGAIASSGARVSSGFAQVMQQRSDLVGDSRQVRLTISPMRFSSALAWSASYVFGWNREQFRGFTSAGGDPFVIGSAPSDFDIRHQITLNASYNVLDVARVAWFVRLASGAPFTPMVGGDINGDGFANDRAFVAGPTTAATPAIAADMQRLLAGAPARVRECLLAQAGTMAARNSCRGPWTSTSNVSISLNPAKIGLSQRVAVSCFITNPFGAFDLALHGESRLHGWGNPSIPDQTLLYLRGFDATGNRYLYDVNPRFGSANSQISGIRQPISLTMSVRVDVGPSREQQTLTRQLDQGRRTDGPRLGEPMILAMYGSGGIPNPIAQLLRESDTLELTGAQADSLAGMNVAYLAGLDAIWQRTAHDLANLPDNYDRGAAYDQYKRAREGSVDLLMQFAPRITRLLTESQKRSLPPLIASYLDRRYLAAIRSGTQGDSGAGAFSNGLAADGGPIVTRTDIIRTGRP